MNSKLHHELGPYYSVYYKIHNFSYVLNDNDIILQTELLEQYQSILIKLSNFDMTFILGTFDNTFDPHLMIYFWNYVFKPYKNRKSYDDYNKMIRRFLLVNNNTFTDEEIINITSIILPFVLYIKRKFTHMIRDENIMINMTPFGKWTKLYKNRVMYDENGKFNKIDLFIQGDFNQFNNSFKQKYYY